MEKTLINLKTEKTLKRNAQRVAKELGLPLGTIINAYLKEFVREKRVVFSAPPVPNKQTRKLLKRIAADIRVGRNVSKPLTYEEATEYLDRL